ncbi:Hpt domain-containing protein [Haliea sp. E1-2-M8]|uniref:Hpt domain-containing protein n=1 Tax=Haliea sp. E1-2-M8 TaxID=3064706 RepID=UPI002728A4F3|nr:Hpt domain-containing protein [Haliea sp. E1-2-M8]MDO8860085.1 Hpt domain-containing protein [Haliea sp. E1-2-M8]
MSRQLAARPEAGSIDVIGLRSLLRPLLASLDQVEAGLIAYSRETACRQPLLESLWAVHHITAALGTLRLHKAEMLALEMERGFLRLLREQVVAERRNLTMGGLMRAIKTLPAYLDHVQRSRIDTGRGLEPCVNNLRRWEGERVRPPALFFYLQLPAGCGISGAAPEPAAETIRRSADVLLAPYLQGAKSALGAAPSVENVRTVARIAHKMHGLFRGTEQERFWLLLVGLCEAIAAGLVEPDECVAQLFKAGAFMIKYAREHGSVADPAMDYHSYLQQMLYYMASCKARPLYVGHIWQVFGIDGNTLHDAERGLIHNDALIAALEGAHSLLNALVDRLQAADLLAAVEGGSTPLPDAATVFEEIRLRLIAAEEIDHAEDIQAARDMLQQVFSGRFSQDVRRGKQVVMSIAGAMVETEIALSNRLRHNGFIPPAVQAFDHLEGLVAATCNQLNQIQGQLQQQPRDEQSLDDCCAALAGIREALSFACLAREAAVVSSCHDWLRNASRSGEVASDTPALQALADALVWLTLYLESRLLDPVEDFSTLLLTAEQHAARLAAFAPAAPQAAVPRPAVPRSDLQPLQQEEEPEAAAPAGENIPQEFRQVFLEESAQIIDRLQALLPEWERGAARDEQLREIRRHFHTFKGNGNAVGLYTLAELGRDVQDMLDRVLESQGPVNTELPALLRELVAALPELVATSGGGGGGDFNLTTVRSLRSRCAGLR